MQDNSASAWFLVIREWQVHIIPCYHPTPTRQLKSRTGNVECQRTDCSHTAGGSQDVVSTTWAASISAEPRHTPSPCNAILRVHSTGMYAYLYQKKPARIFRVALVTTTNKLDTHEQQKEQIMVRAHRVPDNR